MKCPKCKGIMVRRSRYVWSEYQRRFVCIYYWRCIACGYIVEE